MLPSFPVNETACTLLFTSRLSVVRPKWLLVSANHHFRLLGMSLCRWNPKPTARDYTTLTFSELWKWFLSTRLKKMHFFSPTPIWKDLKNIRPQQWNCQQLWASFSARFEMRRNHCPCWGTTLVSTLHIVASSSDDWKHWKCFWFFFLYKAFSFSFDVGRFSECAFRKINLIVS